MKQKYLKLIVLLITALILCYVIYTSRYAFRRNVSKDKLETVRVLKNARRVFLKTQTEH